MSFTKKRYEYINDVNEFNRLLAIARDKRFIRLGPCESKEVGPIAYIDDKLTTIELTMKQGEACTYVFNKTAQATKKTITGLDAYIQLAKSFVKATGYKIPEYNREIGSATALLAYKPDIADHQRVYAISHDVNSAYGWAMSQPMPDTRKPIMFGVVKKGQVGFIVDDEEEINGFITSGTLSLRMVHEGERAEFIFDLMDSPFTEFANKWYEKKSNPKDQEEKEKAKQMLCFSVGYLQRKNPFLRAAIVEYTNEFIRNLIDENTIYVNTDCIISTQPRPDLPIGNAMGQFKKDHEGMFANSGFNYQWDMELPKYRGIPKAWFHEGWDILKDPIPCNKNLYELNGITIQMEARNG